MAEDDKLKLDEDLNLNDESDNLSSGDDFAGELDDMVGEDELEGSPEESDGELDSFFEDLSSIEELDAEEESGAKKESQVPVIPSAPEEPSPAKKVKPKRRFRRRSVTILLLLVLLGLLLAGAFAVYWSSFRDTAPMPVEEGFENPSTPPVEPEMEQVITVEEKPEPPPPPPPREKPQETEAPKPTQATPSVNFFIQVATCSFAKCTEEYKQRLREIGEPIFQMQKKEKYDLIELISKQVYTLQRANYLIDLVNRKNRGAGSASVVYQSNGHRITMGTFTALDRAKEVKFHLERNLSSENLIFSLEHVRKDYRMSKVYAGPYRSGSEARRVLKEFRRKRYFPEAFIVSH